MKQLLPNINLIYLSGIGGIGMSALAKLFQAYNKQVIGSDLVLSEITDDLENRNIKVFNKQEASNVTADIDLLVYSAAVPENNPERQQAKKLGIKQQSYVEVLGDLSKLFKTIAVSGTNGKSTSTAMLAEILIDAGIEPTVILGSQSKKLDRNYYHGDSEYLLVEACEYRDHMLNLTPKAIVLTNIEEEHLDYFKDINHILQSFQKYINKLSQSDNVLVVNQDDDNISQLHLPDCQVSSYGIEEVADVMARDISVAKGKQVFVLEARGQELGEVELRVPGKFNIYNALSAIAMALHLGVSVEVIKKSLADFTGLWRRFEKIKNEKVTVISDYAHHPSGIRATLRAVKEFYPEKRVVAVFQPHQYDRTKKLFNDFVDSLYEADLIILPEVFDVVGRDEKDEYIIGSRHLVDEIKERWPKKKTLYAKNLDQALDLINFNIKPGDVVLVMGAGDIYQICDRIMVRN